MYLLRRKYFLYFFAIHSQSLEHPFPNTFIPTFTPPYFRISHLHALLRTSFSIPGILIPLRSEVVHRVLLHSKFKVSVLIQTNILQFILVKFIRFTYLIANQWFFIGFGIECVLFCLNIFINVRHYIWIFQVSRSISWNQGQFIYWILGKSFRLIILQVYTFNFEIKLSVRILIYA